MDEQEIVDIAKLESAVEAGLLGAILEEKEIDHMILSYHDTAYDGIFQVQKGWGVIRGPKSTADEVLAVLEDIRTGAPGELPDDWEEED